MAHRLDATGLSCPLPVLRAKKALREVPAGEVLEVIATDPSAVKDFEAFCRTTKTTLEAWREEGGVYTFLIRKSP